SFSRDWSSDVCSSDLILVLHLCNTNAMLVFSEVISMRKNADSPGARIKRRRMELGLSVEDVAKALGKDRSTIYRYESDEIENMPVSVLVPLARKSRSEEHTSELQSREKLVCCLLLEK